MIAWDVIICKQSTRTLLLHLEFMYELLIRNEVSLYATLCVLLLCRPVSVPGFKHLYIGRGIYIPSHLYIEMFFLWPVHLLRILLWDKNCHSRST